jgi:hypothetical protein
MGVVGWGRIFVWLLISPRTLQVHAPRIKDSPPNVQFRSASDISLVLVFLHAFLVFGFVFGRSHTVTITFMIPLIFRLVVRNVSVCVLVGN